MVENTVDPDGSLVRHIANTYYLTDIDRAGSLTQRNFDPTGNVISQTDPNNNPDTQNTYVALNRLIKTVDPIAGITNYQYDVNDNLIKVEAPNNAATTYQYDDLGNLLNETSPDHRSINYSYNEAGNLISKTDARNRIDHSEIRFEI